MTFVALLALAPLGCRSGTAERARVLRATDQALAAGSPERAEAGLRRLLRFDPRDGEAALRLAELLLAQGREPDASRVLAELPDDVPLERPERVVQARIWLRLGRLDRASRVLILLEGQGERLEPAHREVIAALAAASPAPLPPLPRGWRGEVVEECLREGRTAAALAVLETLRREQPADVDVARRMAVLLLDDGRAADARRVLAALPTPELTAPDLGLLRARAEIGSGDYAAAAATAKVLPEDAGVRAREQLIDAMVEDQHLRLRGEVARALPPAWRGELCDRLVGARRLDVAADGIESVAGPTLRAKLVERWAGRALEAGDLETLRRHEGLLDGDDLPVKLRARHRLLLDRGRWDEAERLEERLLRLFPDDPGSADIALWRARRLVRSGHPAAGLEAAERAVALDPARPEALLERALALDALGRVEDARRAFRTLQAVDAENPLARAYLASPPGEAAGGSVGTFSVRIEARGSPEAAPAAASPGAGDRGAAVGRRRSGR